MIIRYVKFILCCLSLVVFLLCAIVLHIICVFFPQHRWRLFSYLNMFYAGVLRGIAGVHVVIEGKENIPRSTGYIVISNHLTYLDGVVLGSIVPVIYLSKKAIKKWPIINWMVSISGTIFIDRKRKSASPKSVDEIVQRLRQRANVLLFPEGTSSDGDTLKDFQSVLFAAPLVCQSRIVPVIIRYIKIDSQPVTRLNRHAIYWWGQIPFQVHLYQLLGIRTIEARVKILPSVETAKYQCSSTGRKELAKYAHDIIDNDYRMA